MLVHGAMPDLDNTPVACPACSWAGAASDTGVMFNEAARCPLCGEPVNTADEPVIVEAK